MLTFGGVIGGHFAATPRLVRIRSGAQRHRIQLHPARSSVERSPAADDASPADTFTDLLGRRAGTLTFGITSAALIIAYTRIRSRAGNALLRAPAVRAKVLTALRPRWILCRSLFEFVITLWKLFELRGRRPSPAEISPCPASASHYPPKEPDVHTINA
jgi:hypothetical protein